MPSIRKLPDSCPTERRLHFDPVRPNKSSRYDDQKMTVQNITTEVNKEYKRDACLYCGQFCLKLVEHLLQVHSDKKELENILKLGKKSKGREGCQRHDSADALWVGIKDPSLLL